MSATWIFNFFLYLARLYSRFNWENFPNMVKDIETEVNLCLLNFLQNGNISINEFNHIY